MWAFMCKREDQPWVGVQLSIPQCTSWTSVRGHCGECLWWNCVLSIDTHHTVSGYSYVASDWGLVPGLQTKLKITGVWKYLWKYFLTWTFSVFVRFSSSSDQTITMHETKIVQCGCQVKLNCTDFFLLKGALFFKSIHKTMKTHMYLRASVWCLVYEHLTQCLNQAEHTLSTACLSLIGKIVQVISPSLQNEQYIVIVCSVTAPWKSTPSCPFLPEYNLVATDALPRPSPSTLHRPLVTSALVSVS